MRTAYTITITADDADIEAIVLAATERIATELDHAGHTAGQVVLEREKNIGPFWTSRFVTGYDLTPA